MGGGGGGGEWGGEGGVLLARCRQLSFSRDFSQGVVLPLVQAVGGVRHHPLVAVVYRYSAASVVARAVTTATNDVGVSQSIAVSSMAVDVIAASSHTDVTTSH